MPRRSPFALSLLLLACTTPIESNEAADEVGSETGSESGSSGESGGESASGGSSSASDESSTGSTDGGSSESASSSESESSGSGASETASETATGETESESDSETGEPPSPLWTAPSLWYSVEDRLLYIDIAEADGTVESLVTITITTPMIDGQSGITMLEDGSLLISRESPGASEIYHVPEPPTVESEIEVVTLGVVPDELRIEALYTDCQGLVYLMDTGVSNTSAEGNRLIRFTGDYLAGDLAYEVISDLGMAEVADIDDMGPGIDMLGEVTDGRGFAIDSGTVHDFDYLSGSGTQLGMGGTWGVHVLGGPLFDDGVARLYLLDADARLYEADPQDLALSDVLVTGPTPVGNAAAGWSGLAGPLTECESTLPDPQ